MVEPERHVQDWHVISTYLDDLKDGQLHRFEQDLTQRNRDGLCDDAHAQRSVQ